MNREQTHKHGDEASGREKHGRNNRPTARRGPSGAWSRLKPAVIDPLDAFGLPSKGEIRLHNYANQETYYAKIVERYMKFCAATGGGDTLEAAFASLAVTTEGKQSGNGERLALEHRASDAERPNDLMNVHMAMRKLREGILGSRRRDSFAQQAYIWIIRVSILTQQWESYQPALLHLLFEIHPHTPLSSIELREFVTYHLLDLACRQDDIAEALVVKRRFRHQDLRSTRIINSLIRDDWPLFWRLKRAVDGYQRSLMAFADKRIRLHALKCIGRSYLSADRSYIERCADARWLELVKDSIGWQLQADGVVTIRKPKVK